MRAIPWSICIIFQCSLALAQAEVQRSEDGTTWQQIDSQLREARERRQRLQEELDRLQPRSRQGSSAQEEASKQANTYDPIKNFALQARGYDLLNALSDAEVMALKRKDML